MIAALDLLDAVTCAASRAMPELKELYTDLVPKNFARPSLLVQAITQRADSATRALVQETHHFTLTVFDQTDSYDRSSTERLIAMQTKLLGLFRTGYLAVTGADGSQRALPVQASTGGRDWDRAYVDLQIEFYQPRDDAPDDLPRMETVETTMSIKE